jgi:hypothetical protein
MHGTSSDVQNSKILELSGVQSKATSLFVRIDMVCQSRLPMDTQLLDSGFNFPELRNEMNIAAMTNLNEGSRKDFLLALQKSRSSKLFNLENRAAS